MNPYQGRGLLPVVIAQFAMAVGFSWLLFSDDMPAAVWIAFAAGCLYSMCAGGYEIWRRHVKGRTARP